MDEHTERKRLNDVFPDWYSGGGIFCYLHELDVPWKTEDPAIPASQMLDLEYHGNKSGEKWVAPLVSKLLELLENGDFEEDIPETLALLLVRINGENWRKQWASLEFEYNPIENYSMVEQMTNDQTVDAYGKTRTRTDNLSHTKTGTETDAPNTTETQTPNLTNTRNAETHGFNSVQAVPTDADTQRATGTNTMTRTGQEQRTYNTTDADTGTQTENDGGQDTHTRNYRLTRSGNIGVTTSQQMIESERALWVWNFFYDVVFPDIDRVLTLQIY